jgi:hypothetical protein
MRRGALLFGLVTLVLLLTGCLGSVTEYKVGDRPAGIVVIDVNGDGRPDILAANAGSNTLSVKLQGAHGFFDDVYSMPLPKGAQPSAIVAGVFHANKKPTVVVANRGDDSISIFDRFGPGVAATRTIPLGPGAAPAALALGKVDGDGDTDVLVTSRQPTFPGCSTKGCVLLFRDKGDGLAYSYAAYPVGTDPTVDYDPIAIAVGQLWGSARPEIAVVNRHAGETVVIETKNAGFETAASYTRLGVKSPTAVEIASSTLAVQSSSGDGGLFAARKGDPFGRVAGITKAGALWGPFWVPYHPDIGQVDLPGDAPIKKNELKGMTGGWSGAIDDDRDPDFVAFKPSTDSVVVLNSSHPWASPEALDLGKVAVGATGSKPLKGKVRSDVPVLVNATLSGADASSFRVDTCGKLSAPGGACELTVTFAPASAGVKHATLKVYTSFAGKTDNSSGISWGNPLIALTGTATEDTAPPPPPTGTTQLLTGVADDYGKYAADGGAAFFSTTRSLGMSENRMTVTWQAGQTAPSAAETGFLDRSIAEAQRQGVRVVLSIYPAAASQHDPTQFCAFARAVAQRYPAVREVIVGNEPNKADFWSPVDPAAYTRLLAQCYDALHPLGVTVAGGALSARKVGSGSSPVEFLAGMGRAYAALGRSAPIMDALSFHPYPNPDRIARGADAGYEWPNAGPPDLDRVKQAFEDAFAGTAQPTFASSLRMVIDEIGWQATIAPQYGALYTGSENAPAVDEAQQAQFYAAAIGRIACDPLVSELLLLHLVDERELNAGATSGGWQSGLLRADLSQRPAFASVRSAIGSGCTGAPRAWRPASSVVGGSVTLNAVKQQVRVGGTAQPGVKFTVGAASDEGVTWTLTVKNAAGKVVATKTGTRTAPFDAKTFTTPILVGSGSYTATMTLVATLNGKRVVAASKSASSD